MEEKKNGPLEKTIRLHLALRGGVAPPHPPFAPAYLPVIGSIIGIIVVLLREPSRALPARGAGGGPDDGWFGASSSFGLA